MANPVEVWKAKKHGFDVWPDVERHAAARTPMHEIDSADLERMKWHGFFYRKREKPQRYMNRIRLPASEMNAKQAKEIAYLAYEFGHGIIDITTRANVQVQGLGIDCIPEVAKRLARVDLSSKQTGHDNIRNVFGHPFSGLMSDELYDTRQLCHDVTALFVDCREYADLPRKMNICVSGARSHSAHLWTQDISFLATRDDRDRVMFQVLIGGTQGQKPHLAWHLPVAVSAEQVVDVSRAILDLFRAKGSREKRNTARFRFLVEEIGVSGVLEWLEEKLPYPLEPCLREPVPAASNDELVGWFRQRDTNLWTMGLSVPLGRMSWRQLEGLAVLAKRWGDGNLRTTHEQGMAVASIPTGFKDAAATDAAALGLSVLADPLEQNTMACTGSQFCNIAVTETKGHMFQLIEKLRRKALKLHGIRIHMSGCPSSCAQHFTADIGLKGVRVRRLLGTREGFDVFLGGGIAGRVHMGLPYKLGVDVDQLPTMIEEVVSEYYMRHKAGQSFSAYWREKLQAQEVSKVKDDDYQAATWICEACEFVHSGEDPPVFCPSCAGLRRNFARLEHSSNGNGKSTPEANAETVRKDGFAFAANDADLVPSQGLTVTLAGNDYALFRVGDEVHAIDSECPHEGAPLAEGDIKDGVVSCPWHGWTFQACSGCSINPAGNDVKRYDTLVENGKIFIRTGQPAIVQRGGQAHFAPKTPQNEPVPDALRKLARPVEATLPVVEVVDESPDVKTFRLDNSERKIPLDLPGRFVKMCVNVDGENLWRSFTISSSPAQPERIDLTIKLNPLGVVSRHLFENVTSGNQLVIKGPQGGFLYDPSKHGEPLVLVSAGSGITPMISIVRFLEDRGLDVPVHFIYGARREDDILFLKQCKAWQKSLAKFRYYVSLSAGSDQWQGPRGRLSVESLLEQVEQVAGNRYFLCGPNEFMDEFKAALEQSNVPASHVHTEQFHAGTLVAC